MTLTSPRSGQLVRVLVVGYGALVAEALGALLRGVPGIDVVAAVPAGDVAQAPEAFDVVVLDELVDVAALPLRDWLRRSSALTLLQVSAAGRAPTAAAHAAPAARATPRTALELAAALRRVAAERARLGLPD